MGFIILLCHVILSCYLKDKTCCREFLFPVMLFIDRSSAEIIHTLIWQKKIRGLLRLLFFLKKRNNVPLFLKLQQNLYFYIFFFYNKTEQNTFQFFTIL